MAAPKNESEKNQEIPSKHKHMLMDLRDQPLTCPMLDLHHSAFMGFPDRHRPLGRQLPYHEPPIGVA